MKTNKVSVTHAIDLYYNQHAKELKKAFGSERSAKAHMKYDIADLPSNYFKTHKQANQVFNDWFDRKVDPYGAQLRQAKRDAVNRNIWGDQRRLNNRIDKMNINNSGKSYGSQNGFDLTIGDYYNVKGSDYVLAQIIATQGHTEFEYWEYIDGGLV